MQRSLRTWFALSLVLATAPACKPVVCPPGKARAGDECRPLPVRDAGSQDGGMDQADAATQSNGDKGRTMDASTEDANNAPATLDAGEPDANEQDAGPSCFIDRDQDGFGAGAPVPCNTEVDGGTLATEDGDCDDDNAQRSPSLSDVCGDNIDNDCNGKPDDATNNACNGPCSAQLGHQPGEKCSNGLLGACARESEYVCQGDKTTVCNAPMVNASSELCGDNIDNDCDGAKDEADAVDAQTWFQDCDDDGYAASTVGSKPSCTKPAAVGACKSWVTTVPVPGSTQDCNDTSQTYRPGADFGLPTDGSTSPDLNCDGTNEKSPLIWLTDGKVLQWSGVSPCMVNVDVNCAGWLQSPPECAKSLQDRNPIRRKACGSSGCVSFDSENGVQLCR